MSTAVKDKVYGDGADVGDILVSSWGYDQTNISWYRVERRTEKSVWLVELKGQLTNGEEGFMQGHSMPTTEVRTRTRWVKGKGDIDDTVFRRKLSFSNWRGEGAEEPYVRLSSYEFARVWDGSKQWTSWYA